MWVAINGTACWTASLVWLQVECIWEEKKKGTLCINSLVVKVYHINFRNISKTSNSNGSSLTMPMHCLFVDVRPICDVIINGLHTWGICSAPMFNEQCMKIIFGQYLQGCNGFVYKAHSKVPWFSLFFHFMPSPAVTAYFNVVGSKRFRIRTWYLPFASQTPMQCLKDCLGAKISVGVV